MGFVASDPLCSFKLLSSRRVHANMLNLIFFGKPGAGKGTQAELVKKKYGLIHISTGDLFRSHIKNQTLLGRTTQEYLNSGKLVPDEITIKMLEAEFGEYVKPKGFILDGFPRTVGQAKSLEKFFEGKNLSLTKVISIEVDEKTLIERLLNRGKISGRTDDLDLKKIQKRFQEYNDKTSPLIDFYTNRDKFQAVNGLGTINQISERLYDLIDSI